MTNNNNNNVLKNGEIVWFYVSIAHVITASVTHQNCTSFMSALHQCRVSITPVSNQHYTSVVSALYQ